MSLLSRRRFLAGAASFAAAAGLTRSSAGSAFTMPLAPPPVPGVGRPVPLRLVAAEQPTALPCFAGKSLPMWRFSDATWLPVVRMNLGDRLDAVFENRLPRPGEHSSVHWHGIRLPNDQDGVPYLVQKPVDPGETFHYSFVPPDAGTFFFHTHCNTAEQLGRGLAGVLIVDGDTTAPYAADEIVYLRDWRADDDGFRSFFTSKGASRAGTYGNVRSANGEALAEIRLPASSDCRLRVINSDPTRVMEIAIPGAEAAVVAIDGIAVPPFPLSSWHIGPGMRFDVVVRSPAPGKVATIVDQRLEDVVELVRLVGAGEAGPARAFDPVPLRAGRVPEPDLAAAERLTFVFAANAASAPPEVAANDPLSALLIGSLCLSEEEFWTINEANWPGRDHSRLPPPLARLRLGRSYAFTLRNGSRIVHPIHIHGHSFKVLRSNQRALPVHHADTVLLMPEEEIEVAFVADNPGKWMFHCHVIEHQETGMMGYLDIA